MADVSIDATVSTATARGMRSVVFTTDLIGYWFYLDSDGVFGYAKTTDGGATWGAQVDVDGAAATTTVAFDVWFDQWTPGNTTGTLIHCWWFDVTNDLVRWRALNTTGDTLGTVSTVFTGASAVAGRGAFVSGTRARNGYLYCAFDLDAGAERGFHRSVNGAVWGALLSSTFVEATLDTCKLYPASGTGDDQDCWALYYDASALALTLKLWDGSANAQVESATIGVAHTDGATDLTGQFGFDAMVRHSDGHLIVAALSGRDVAASTHQVFDITSTSTITTKTAIAASTDDHYYPQVFIDQLTDAIYVAYNGKRDGSEVLDTTTKVYYTKSTDGGTTWTAGDTAYMEGAAGLVQQVWCPQSGRRFYVGWRVGTTLVGNKVNSVVMAPPADQAVTGTTITSGLVVSTPSIPIWPPPISSFVQVEYFDLAQASPNFDAQYDLSTDFDADYPANIFGQSFHASARFSGIQGLLWSGELADGTFVLEVHAGDPSGTILATVLKPVVAGPRSFRLVRFDFPTIDPGGSSTLYTWTMTRTGATGLADNSALAYGDPMAPAGNPAHLWFDGDPGWTSGEDFTYFTRVFSESVFAPTVTPAAGAGDQAVAGATLAAGSVISAPTVTPGAVPITGVSVASSAGTFAPTLAAAVTTATWASTTGLFAPQVVPTQAITTATIAAGSGTSAPTLAFALTAASCVSTATLFAPTVTTAQVVTGATLAAGSVLFAPALSGLVRARGFGYIMTTS